MSVRPSWYHVSSNPFFFWFLFFAYFSSFYFIWFRIVCFLLCLFQGLQYENINELNGCVGVCIYVYIWFEFYRKRITAFNVHSYGFKNFWFFSLFFAFFFFFEKKNFFVTFCCRGDFLLFMGNFFFLWLEWVLKCQHKIKTPFA